ncbi:hypothetical protein P5673_019399 [Acropora cervicornis]|uniref:Uncharacterized protein n=1 Tax=Acropora cervicornis TaxID=6130 RepID=A0AAD9QBI9_ACRCE|nr:hypothetical protein P5673_019399 [Acropora cervicornis]
MDLMKGGEWFLIPSSNKRSATDGCRVTYPSEPTVKPTGFSTMANTPSFSPVKDNIDGILTFLLHIICCSDPLTYHSKEFAIRNGEFYNSIIKKTCHIECIIGTKSHSLWTIKITLITKGTYKPAKRNNEQKKNFPNELGTESKRFKMAVSYGVSSEGLAT